MGYPKQKQNEYNKTYYTENKDAIAEKQSTKNVANFVAVLFAMIISGNLLSQPIVSIDVHSTKPK